MSAVVEDTDVRERFQMVIDARKTVKELIQLFDRLAESTKFTAEEKPVCFGMLLSQASAKAKPEDAMSLLAAIRRTNAMALMRKGYSYDDAEFFSSKVVKRLLTSVTLEREPLLQVVDALQRSGVTSDLGNCLSLAVLSKMDYASLDRIATLTDPTYDPKADESLTEDGDELMTEALF